jgi:hypothetical protein
MEEKRRPGPYRAEFGAIHREGARGFIFTVNTPDYAAEVASALNAELLVPDLLEALKLYDAWLALPQDRGGKDGPKGRALDAFIKAKDAAIAKATGAASPTPRSTT